MHDMGTLQPGLPSAIAVPQGYNIIVIDLQNKINAFNFLKLVINFFKKLKIRKVVPHIFKKYKKIINNITVNHNHLPLTLNAINS